MPEQTVELRGPCPKHIVDVIDSFSMARHMTRTDLVNEILQEWVDRRIHECSVINAVARGNPVLSDKLGL